MNNKNKQRNIMISIGVLGIGLFAGLFLTLENHITQTNLMNGVDSVPEVIIYEGKIAECEDRMMDDCIRVGGGGSIEKIQ